MWLEDRWFSGSGPALDACVLDLEQGLYSPAPPGTAAPVRWSGPCSCPAPWWRGFGEPAELPVTRPGDPLSLLWTALSSMVRWGSKAPLPSQWGSLGVVFTRICVLRQSKWFIMYEVVWGPVSESHRYISIFKRLIPPSDYWDYLGKHGGQDGVGEEKHYNVFVQKANKGFFSFKRVFCWTGNSRPLCVISNSQRHSISQPCNLMFLLPIGTILCL